jgi:phage shock protein E
VRFRALAWIGLIPSIPPLKANVKQIKGQGPPMKIIKILIVTILSIVPGVLTTPAFAAGDAAAPLIIDARTEAEWNEGHLDGAVLIPYDTIAQGITAVAPDKKTEIYLYCRTGRRSGIALETLKKAGYSNLTNLGSKENAAKELGKPIVK